MALSTAPLDADVDLAIEGVYCCEQSSEPELILPVAWFQDCTASSAGALLPVKINYTTAEC